MNQITFYTYICEYCKKQLLSRKNIDVKKEVIFCNKICQEEFNKRIKLLEFADNVLKNEEKKHE
jgi:predicted SprT family Zn-dependent metalloprotease